MCTYHTTLPKTPIEWGVIGMVRKFHRITRCVLVAATVFLVSGSSAVANERAVETLEPIEVRGTTPLMTSPVPLKKVPTNVQVLTGDSIKDQGGLNLTDTLSRELAGVSLTHVQNNPFQPDLTYRGFTSSFLIGTPPGLSVFVDGARVNEPLADQVNWDLIPTDAIDRLELIPGTNPIYGRNTLGGAIVMRTKRGFTSPGTAVELWGGSFARYRALVQHGGSTGNFDYFVSGNLFFDVGYRDYSKSHVGNLFAKGGYLDAKNDLTFSLTHINNKLTGNGPLPRSRLRRDRSEVYTQPDIFEPDLWFANSQYQRVLGPGLSLSANGYARLLDVDQFNLDVEETVDARTNQLGWGTSLELSYQGTALGRAFSLTLGGSYSGASLDHLIAEQEEDEEDEHKTDDGGDESDGFEVETHVRSKTHAGGPFITMSAEPIKDLTVTLSGRYEVTNLAIQDRLAGTEFATGTAGRENDASGNHTFRRFNPAIGVTYELTEQFSLYASYNESYRAPTAGELTCANPEAPCPIPTAMVDDPPLDPVKGKTWETGVRWDFDSRVHATFALFRTDLKDDILFRNDPKSRVLGYFQNVDATRRQGIEFSLRGKWNWGRWFLNYTITNATFEEDIELFTFANENRTADVRAGDRLPLVPPHRVNGGIEVFLGRSWRLSIDSSFTDSQRLRGDEANEHGRLDAYFMTNAVVDFTFRNYTVFLHIENIFDEEYETYGAFHDNVVDNSGVEPFMGPGAPRSAYAGIRMEF